MITILVFIIKMVIVNLKREFNSKKNNNLNYSNNKSKSL